MHAKFLRAFIRRLLYLSKLAKQPNHHLRLSREARSDIEWWYRFAAEWNGVSILQAQKRERPDIIMTSDASGRWECGAFWEQNWFQLQWPGAL